MLVLKDSDEVAYYNFKFPLHVSPLRCTPENGGLHALVCQDPLIKNLTQVAVYRHSLVLTSGVQIVCIHGVHRHVLKVLMERTVQQMAI